MKHIFKLSFICLLTVFASCKKDTSLTPIDTTDPVDQNTNIEARLSSYVGERNPNAVFNSQVDLIAGQFTVVGNVLVENDANNIYVTYTITKPNTKMTETHLYIGDCDLIPKTCKGNPRVGNFPYSSTLSTCGSSAYKTTITYVIPYTEQFCGCIAAHAVVKTGCKTETAWREGIRFVQQGNWAMYDSICMGPIDPP